MEQKLHSWFFCFMVRVDIELWLRLRDRKVTTDTRNRKKRRPKDRCVNLFFTSQCDGAIVRATFYQFAMRPHLLYRNSRSQQEREREIPSIMHTQHLRFSRFFIALRCWFPLNRHDRRLHIYESLSLSLSSLLSYHSQVWRTERAQNVWGVSESLEAKCWLFAWSFVHTALTGLQAIK